MNQHYLSRFYLKRFFFPVYSQLSGTTKQKNKAAQKLKTYIYTYPILEKNPLEINTATNHFERPGIDYFYSDDIDLKDEKNSLEKKISFKENKWARMFDDINISGDFEKHKEKLIEFVFFNSIKSFFTKKYLIDWSHEYFNFYQRKAKKEALSFDFFNNKNFLNATENNRSFFEGEIEKNNRNQLKKIFDFELKNTIWDAIIYTSKNNIVLNDSPFLCINENGKITRNFNPKKCKYIMYPFNHEKMILLYKKGKNKLKKYEYLQLINKYNNFFKYNYFNFLWSKNSIKNHKKSTKIKKFHKIPNKEILSDKLIASYIYYSINKDKALLKRILTEYDNISGRLYYRMRINIMQYYELFYIQLY